MTVEEILKACDGYLHSGNRRAKISRISTDTRAIKPGEIFLALRGEKYDGHSFIADAFKKKAAGVIVSSLPGVLSRESVVIRVEDTLSALQRIASHVRDKFAPTIIAITGSNGKTTTKEMLAAILSQQFVTLKSQASFNNEVGVPLSLLQIASEHQVCVLEIGMSAKGELRDLARIAKPDIGIVTNVGPAHLANFKSTDEIAQAKAELLDEVSGTCILNADDAYFRLLKERCRTKLTTFGIREDADFHADSIRELSSEGIVFRVNREFEIKLPVRGRHNVYNALASIAAASCLDIDAGALFRALEEFCLPAQRTEIKGYGSMTVINDTYNANPVSMKAAIELLTSPFGKESSRVAGAEGRKILVIGDMLELGEEAVESHEEIGRLVAQSDIDVLLATGALSKSTAEAAVQEGMKKVFFCKSKEELIKKLLSELRPCDTILVKGSRAMQMEKVVERINCELGIKD